VAGELAATITGSTKPSSSRAASRSRCRNPRALADLGSHLLRTVTSRRARRAGASFKADPYNKLHTTC